MKRNKKERKKNVVSSAVVRRLPKYHRYLGHIQDSGIVRVSSQELSDITGCTASQIRQDLNNFGGFGQQGYGYNVDSLREEIGKIIGMDKDYEVILIGAGNIGHSLANYQPFEDSGFHIRAIFDANNKIIGTELAGIPILDVRDLAEYLEGHEVDIAVIAIPQQYAQEVCNTCSEGGVRGIWNFAPIDLDVPEGVVLENVHLEESLSTLIYYMGNPEDFRGAK